MRPESGTSLPEPFRRSIDSWRYGIRGNDPGSFSWNTGVNSATWGSIRKPPIERLFRIIETVLRTNGIMFDVLIRVAELFETIGGLTFAAEVYSEAGAIADRIEDRLRSTLAYNGLGWILINRVTMRSQPVDWKAHLPWQPNSATRI